MNNEEVKNLITAIGGLAELLEVFRDQCLSHGFTRAESISLCKAYIAVAISGGDATMKIECCYKCEKRHPGCHANCEEYKRQKAAWNEQKEAASKEKSKNDLCFGSRRR